MSTRGESEMTATNWKKWERLAQQMTDTDLAYFYLFYNRRAMIAWENERVYEIRLCISSEINRRPRPLDIVRQVQELREMGASEFHTAFTGVERAFYGRVEQC